MSEQDQERKEEACLVLEEIQELAGDLWGSIQMYTNKPPRPSTMRCLALFRDRLKKMIVEQEKNNYELIDNGNNERN